MTCQLICKCEWINVNVNIELTIINCTKVVQVDDVGRRRHARTSEIYAGAKQAKFPYFSKGKLVSAWLISKSSGIFLYKSSFCASNSWPAFCFVLVFVTNHATPTFYVIRPELLRKKVFITFEIWIFISQKCMDSLQEAFIHHPEPCEARFITDACTLFHVFWTVDKKHAYPHCKAWRGQDNF